MNTASSPKIFTNLRSRQICISPREMRQRVLLWAHLPACVEIAPTNSLAKLANHCAKKSLAGSGGACDSGAMEPSALDHVLTGIEVGEV
ncbi:MAG: hypothetical protein EPN60_19000 [Nevskiaceae bacterium]|nr:MAG: hypothetical protein EPO48_15885 [Nevskiaceae bacterium]TAM21060.1 MAG: hypothetical protein EPN60_19000 [Nevskiaceae bacterium]